MILVGSPQQMYRAVVQDASHIVDDLGKIARIHGQMEAYQAAALYKLARQQNRHGANFLEIGTLHGYSAALLSLAAPRANIITLNPRKDENAIARKNLRGYPNVRVLDVKSWEHLIDYAGPELDLIFVDGDHNRIALDLPWWQHLKVGGLMIFHDYSPNASAIVYAVLNKVSEILKRDPDVRVIDTEKLIGMVGFIRQADDPNLIGVE